MTQSHIGTILVALLAACVVALVAVCLVALVASALARWQLDREVEELLRAGVRIVSTGGQK